MTRFLTFYETIKRDGFVKSPSGLSFRVKREIFILQPIEKIKISPAVEMTHSTNLTFYETIKRGFSKKECISNYGPISNCWVTMDSLNGYVKKRGCVFSPNGLRYKFKGLD